MGFHPGTFAGMPHSASPVARRRTFRGSARAAARRTAWPGRAPVCNHLANKLTAALTVLAEIKTMKKDIAAAVHELRGTPLVVHGEATTLMSLDAKKRREVSAQA